MSSDIRDEKSDHFFLTERYGKTNRYVIRKIETKEHKSEKTAESYAEFCIKNIENTSFVNIIKCILIKKIVRQVKK